MKTCPNCKSEMDDNFDLCWNCQYSFSENRTVPKTEFSECCPYCKIEVDSSYTICPNCQHKLGEKRIPTEPSGFSGNLKIDCLRCRVPMFFKGNSRFHEGARAGILGNLIESRESFDLYFCPQCGKIEFFIQPETKSV